MGHIGFDKMEAADTAFSTHAFAHYLHHKYFEVDYSDGMVPFDPWFGTWHDGSTDGQARMDARFAKKPARLNAGK